MTSNTTDKIIKFLLRNPIAWLGGLIINQSHYGIVIGVLLFSRWKNWEILQPETITYLLGLTIVLCISGISKVLLVKTFHQYFHREAHSCYWCKKTAVETQHKIKINKRIVKTNVMISVVTFFLLVTVWLPIITHHLWVNTKFENIAFVLSVSVAIFVSILSGIVELVFAFCTTAYKMTWLESTLVTANLIILKWKELFEKVVVTTAWFSIWAGAFVILTNHLDIELFLAPILIMLGAWHQIYWVGQLDKNLAIIGSETLPGKLKIHSTLTR